MSARRRASLYKSGHTFATKLQEPDIPGGSDSKSVCLQCRRPGFDPWVGKILWRRKWQPTPVILPGKSHGRRSLVGYSPWGRKESDTTKRFHFHFLLSCIGEGNGNPLQHSCLENPRDGGAWWAAVFGVAQSRTLLKQLSSSISMTLLQGNQHFSVPRTGGSEGHGMLSAKARAVLRPANRHSVQ